MISWRALGAVAWGLMVGCSGGSDAGTSANGSTGSMATSTSTAAGSGSTAAAASETGADATGAGLGCCERHAAAGCDESEVATCVCTELPECCAFEWTQRCVDLATSECNATCMPDGADTTGAVDPTTGGAGSTGIDPGSDGGSADTGGGGPGGACCTPTQMPGCADDMALEQCVCGEDPFCCDMQWDGKCVGVAVNSCGAECGGNGGGGDCCMPNGSPGCDDAMTQDCVCMIDAFCCNQMWDQKCVQVATQQCMGC
ncbi:MAG: hypothetical protein K0V04_18855 [Deltaproteobacteria bacterium]|nr:hypothetical protein [Deltaproteobacteria bacterium]